MLYSYYFSVDQKILLILIQFKYVVITLLNLIHIFLIFVIKKILVLVAEYSTACYVSKILKFE